MKNSSHKEDRKKYVFFTDPDVVAKRAEISAVTAQKQALTQDLRVQTLKRDSPYLGIQPLNIKNLFLCPGYSYPFPFISAVKQKFALKDHDTSVRIHDPNSVVKSNLASSVIEQEMDIRPLKIPDVKITSKTLEFSSRENTISKELSSTRSEVSTKEILYNRSDKTSKTGERVQRKLDFVVAGSSVINSEIEPLKAPNVSIAFNLSKKKEHGRDSSREKENRSKRIKKDDFLCAKRYESVQDQVKRSRSPRHVSRRDTVDTSDIRLLKNDRLLYMSKSDLTTSKDKNFVTSTVKKDSDKRQKSFNVQSVDSIKEYVSAGKPRISGNYNETSAFPSWKVSEEVILSDNKVSSSVNNENKLKDICNLKKLEIEDLKYKSELDSKQLKQDKVIITRKEQTKRICDKNKMPNTSKLEGKRSTNLDESLENIESPSEITNSFKNRANAYPISVTRHSKSIDSETFSESDVNNSARLAKTSENHTSYSEHLNMTQVETVSHTEKDEESYSQNVFTKEATTNDDSNDMDVNTLPDSLFDSRRISFRDGYTQQEFHNLIAPEKMTLEPRFKRRSNCIESNDLEIDTRCPKSKLSHTKSEKGIQEGIQLMHPTALYMQFQTELHLYDSHVESLRQVMDVEKHLYNATCEQEQKLQKISEKDEELKKTAEVGESLVIDKEDVEENLPSNLLDYMKKNVEIRKPNDEGNVDESNKTYGKLNKAVAEIQTQTVNDMATQTDLSLNERNAENKLSKIREKVYEQLLAGNQVSQLSLDSKYETLDQVEDDISLPKIKNVMSEFSILHETTSSKKTETGTEIVSRDVTCSFAELSIENQQYSEIAQCLNENERLIKHEKERCTKFEEIYKAYMEIAYDKQKKIEQLEDQKRALKNRGQDSRPLKKKQRALLMKLIRGTHYAERIKAAVNIIKKRTLLLQHERILLSQSQDMSTKNHILTKLKRSADSQSPRKLSGPMKGYDIRSNSSLSSVIDSDKSLHDQSQGDARLKTLGSDVHSKLDSIKSNVSTRLAKDTNTRCDESKELQKSLAKSQKKSDVLKYEVRSRKYEEKMPGANVLRQKQNQLDVKSKRYQGHSMKQLLGSQESLVMSPRPDALDVKSESDVLEELSRILQTEETATISRERNKDLTSNSNANSKSIEEQINTTLQDTNTKTTKSPQISEDLLQTISSQSSKKSDKSIVSDRDVSKKSQHSTELKTNSKRKSSNYQKTKSSSSTLTENVLRSISSSYIFEGLLNHHDKRAKLKNESSQLDSNNESLILDESERKHSGVVKDKTSTNKCETKESIISKQAFNRNVENNVENPSKNEQGIHVSTSFTISHSESETSFSKSIRLELRKKSENKDFEQILTEREVALTSRKKCVENYMARHARLKAEEDRVTRMEQAAYYKLVAEAVLQDTTVSSDMSDIEGRITALTEEVAKRRNEIARLKKEAKKRAKKQLLDMETNLLNKIKIYDASIHKMRKKLDSKKSFKETDKLAIEPRSLADYKVPEIPHIKKIEDIYKKNDLLRSRSESDLLSMRNQPKNSKLASFLTHNDERESSSKNSVKTTDTTASKSINITDNSHNIQTTLDDHTLTGTHNKVHTPISRPSSMNNSQFGKHAQKSVIASRDAKDIQINSNTELEVRTMSDVKSSHQNTISTDNELIVSINKSERKISTIESDIQGIKSVDYSTSISRKSDSSTKNVAHATVDFNTLSFSRKLDFLQLNNKNLNENISSLENNMREIMSRLSKESNGKSKVDNDDKNTLQDTSDVISKSVFSDKISNIANEEKQTISHETKINTESFATSINDENLKSKDLSYDVTDKIINDEISATIPEEAISLSNSVHEIDYEAKSKEIMNEIERSIISEHLETTTYSENNYSATLEDRNKESLNDLLSKLDVKSISEIFSKESKRSDIATEIVDNAKKDISEEEEQEKTKENHSAEIYLSRTLSERFSTKSLHSPIISGHRSKIAYRTSDDNSQSTRSVVSSQLSRHLASDASELSEYIPEVSKDVNSLASNTDQSQLRTITPKDVSQDNNDWTTSDSFEVAQNEEGEQKHSQDSRSVSEHIDDSSNNTSERDVHVDDKKAKSKLAGEANVSAFISKEASIDVELHNVTFTNTTLESHTIKNNDELDDILDIIAREDNQVENISNGKKFNISDSITELLEKVEDIAKDDEKSAENHLEEILCDMNININNQLETVSDTSMLKREEEEDTNENNVISQSTANKSKQEEATDSWLEIKTDDKHDKEESPRETMSEVKEIIITELDSDSIEDNALSELEIDAKVELAEEEETDEDHRCVVEKSKEVFVEIQECLEPILEQDSSDGEQLDNLVEVAESGLDTLEKHFAPSRDSLKSIRDDAALVQIEDNVDPKNNETATSEEAKVTENLNKTFDILKDPEYEDISEESLEVSEILDKHDSSKAGIAKKSSLPERYEVTQKSDEVLRILDQLSQKSSLESTSNSRKSEKSVTEDINEFLRRVSVEDDSLSLETSKKIQEESSRKMDVSRDRFREETKQVKLSMETSDVGLFENKSVALSKLAEHDADDKSSRIMYELREKVAQLQEQDDSSDSSEAGETPRGVSEIEMDSPRDLNDSRLDIDILDDDLLSGTKGASQNDIKTNFHSASIVATSEKDIETMIDKLKASLEQPGLEVAELEAKLLRIEQLQIELEIKKLEAEEVSYYVREIPNKPPPPYTPPGDGRLLTSLDLVLPVTSVIPSNVEELTAFTERAAALIYAAKLADEDIASLEVPAEIYELTNDENESVARDRRIYNTFLFNLCKEIIVEVYRAEYEKPGPSWTKPNVKTKPIMKIPKSEEELIKYVNKEVATLFGFKAKLQRENMVMRWSRKRRDRVDELLAREAQAEEDEWTKFHHDELAVKNGLTVAILDTLLMETVNVVKSAYGKKRRRMMI
ncbi:centrosome-associated protein 350-like isoform X2 [Pseudomyrmex gracilis]|uniref:centrosome-associated protein 350-like isoform X2 n=1 Tax=Pseudomyrmex gracilis TaxID=219809 RepID=UPI0009958121|nr:centrosome-associated protein 350-like isoform X2 [Pseudomyrmex gracilis]